MQPRAEEIHARLALPQRTEPRTANPERGGPVTPEQRVRPIIRAGLGCVGVESEGELHGWVLRYLDGPLGMLWVEEAHRRRGLARRLIVRARADLEAAGRPCFCYIVDGNAASETLFEGAGWARVADADWVGFGAKA